MIRTFNLQEAATFLIISSAHLRIKAATGIILGAKPGKNWCFLEQDLIDYFRSLYPKVIKTQM